MGLGAACPGPAPPTSESHPAPRAQRTLSSRLAGALLSFLRRCGLLSHAQPSPQGQAPRQFQPGASLRSTLLSRKIGDRGAVGRAEWAVKGLQWSRRQVGQSANCGLRWPTAHFCEWGFPGPQPVFRAGCSCFYTVRQTSPQSQRYSPPQP